VRSPVFIYVVVIWSCYRSMIACGCRSNREVVVDLPYFWILNKEDNWFWPLICSRNEKGKRWNE
jgi:hypothetical protein